MVLCNFKTIFSHIVRSLWMHVTPCDRHDNTRVSTAVNLLFGLPVVQLMVCVVVVEGSENWTWRISRNSAEINGQMQQWCVCVCINKSELKGHQGYTDFALFLAVFTSLMNYHELVYGIFCTYTLTHTWNTMKTCLNTNKLIYDFMHELNWVNESMKCVKWNMSYEFIHELILEISEITWNICKKKIPLKFIPYSSSISVLSSLSVSTCQIFLNNR